MVLCTSHIHLVIRLSFCMLLWACVGHKVTSHPDNYSSTYSPARISLLHDLLKTIFCGSNHVYMIENTMASTTEVNTIFFISISILYAFMRLFGLVPWVATFLRSIYLRTLGFQIPKALTSQVPVFSKRKCLLEFARKPNPPKPLFSIAGRFAPVEILCISKRFLYVRTGSLPHVGEVF